MKIRFLVLALLLAGLFSGCSGAGGGDGRSYEELLEQSRLYSLDQEYEQAMDCALAALSQAEAAGRTGREAEALCMAANIDLVTMRDEQAWERASWAEGLSRGREGRLLSLCKGAPTMTMMLLPRI